MPDKTVKTEGESKIHEPLSSYHPSPFKVDEPTLQNFAPPYYGHGPIYVSKEQKREEKQKKIYVPIDLERQYHSRPFTFYHFYFRPIPFDKPSIRGTIWYASAKVCREMN